MIVKITGAINTDYPLSQLRDMLDTMTAELINLERRYNAGSLPYPIIRRFRDGNNQITIQLDERGEA